ncbi:MAG: class I SAM-dependent methyltransferase [Treponema sp.]|nr:class I SAM-dependent methyltransferase [Treponema sp.]
MENNKPVLEFYENNENEDNRINRSRLEFVRTKELICRVLPENKIRIIDLCGATGHYAYWLAKKGHEVHLRDLSPRHITEAKANEKNYNAKLASIALGDARSTECEDNSFDMVLLMGALYHLQVKEDRLQCLKEVNRILKPGGTAVFAYINRYASMLDGFLRGFIDDPAFRKIVDNDIATGRHVNADNNPNYFTNAFFHTTDEIHGELLQTNFCNTMLFAVEGFGVFLNHEEYFKDEEKLRTLLHYIRITEQNMEMIGLSDHLLVICKKT